MPFSKSFDFASGATGERFQNPFWKLKEAILGAKLRKAVFDVKSFGNSIVSAAIKQRETKNGSRNRDTNQDYPPQNNLINSLLDHIDDHQVVADAAMNYLSAGACAQDFGSTDANLRFREGYNSTIIDLDILSLDAPSSCTEDDIVRVALGLP